MRHTLYNSAKAVFALAPAVRTNGAVSGAAVDARQFRVATVVVISGVMTDGSVAVIVEDSANGSTGWAAVTADRQQGTLPTIAATDDSAIWEIGVVVDPLRPYLRPTLTTSGATSGGIAAAAVLLSQGNSEPVTRP